MFEDVTQQTLDLLNKMPNGPLSKATIAQATGLNAVDLRGPALNLYPVITPLRNKLPRETSPYGGLSTQWKAITAINATGQTAGVQEGKRGPEIPVTEKDFLATYAGLGQEASINWEAVWAGGKEFDNKASLTKALLASVMISEEAILMGGNGSLALGTPAAPVAVAVLNATTPGTLTQQAGNLVFVVALTPEGLQLATGQMNGLGLQPVLAGTTVKASVARLNIDGSVTNHGGGSSNVSAASNAVTTDGTHGTVSATVTAVKGAAGYAWYIGLAAGTATLAAITTVNAVTITANPVGTQAANAITADNSVNATEFNGFLTIAQTTGSGSYYKSLDNAGYTTDTANGIVEINTAFQSFWDNARLGPNTMWVHSQEMRNLTKKAVNAGASSVIRFNQAQGNPKLQMGAAIEQIFNMFTNSWVDVRIHPTIPAGTSLFTTDEIPYPMAEVGTVNLVRCRRDYYQIEWPFVSRQYVYGVYADEVLVCRAPLSLGVIANAANS